MHVSCLGSSMFLPFFGLLFLPIDRERVFEACANEWGQAMGDGLEL